MIIVMMTVLTMTRVLIIIMMNMMRMTMVELQYFCGVPTSYLPHLLPPTPKNHSNCTTMMGRTIMMMTMMPTMIMITNMVVIVMMTNCTIMIKSSRGR